MFRILSEVYRIAKRRNLTPPHQTVEDWETRFRPRHLQDEEANSYRWFNPGHRQLR